MEIRCPIHGTIPLMDEESSIVIHPFFQRLRSIRQMGLSDFAFPGATHTRFIHSIGVMSIAGRAFDKLFAKELIGRDATEFLRLKETVKLAALLHDVGHAPLSHATESVMPKLEKLNLPSRYRDPQRIKEKDQASHEDYTILSITNSSLSAAFKDVDMAFGVKKEGVADLIQGNTQDPAYYTIKNINYFPLLNQLISSEMDCDRLDYLSRDSYFCGVSYGKVDLDWIIDNLEVCLEEGQAFLAISERSVTTFEDFLLGRFHMFLMVYFHYRAVCLEQLLLRYFKSAPKEYSIPADIEEYQRHDDNLLLSILKGSKNHYAQQIIRNNIPQKIYESFNEKQHQKLDSIQTLLDQKGIEYIRSSSSGRLSKYYNGDRPLHKSVPLKVAFNIFQSSQKIYQDIHEVSSLYLKYEEQHSINRIHADLGSLDLETLQKIQDLILH